MGIESPLTPSSQTSSQGLVQTLPQTAGKGLASRINSIASSNFLFAMSFTYAFTLIPAGHAFVHSGIPLTSILYFLPCPVRVPFSPPIMDSALKFSFTFSFVFRRTPQTLNNGSLLKINA